MSRRGSAGSDTSRFRLQIAEEELAKAVDEMRRLIQKSKNKKHEDHKIRIEQIGADRFRLSIEHGIARLSMDLVSLKQLEREASEESKNVLFISAASEQLKKDAEELIVEAMEVVSLAEEHGSQEGWSES